MSKHDFGADVSALFKSAARRSFAISVLSAAFLAALPLLPAANPVHISATPAAGGGWLTRLNQWRTSTGLSALSENTTWSAGDSAHALYMVKNDLVTHYETPGTPYYTVDGDTAARNSNIQVSSTTSTTDVDAIDWWMGAPFHAMGMMDPRLTTTGFGSYREVKSGWQEGAAVDTLRGNPFTGGTYPVFFPGNGTTEPLTNYSGYEFPDPLQACAGYSLPTGLPVFIQVGGSVATTASPIHSFTGNGVALAHCVIDSNSPSVGSSLTYRGGVIVIPRQPLQAGVRYVVALTVNGAPYTWSFTVGTFFTVTGVSPSFGSPAGGTAVTISGSGFANGLTSVKFGAASAAGFTVVNDSTVTAISPAHAVANVDITLTTAAGTTPITPADRYAFATPCTSVTIAASPPSPSPSGTQVTFTGAAVCPSPNPFYEFWVRPAAQSTWQLVQAYSTSNQYDWNSNGTAAGLVYFGVWARDANSPGIVNSGGMGTTDAFTSLPYTVTSATCPAVTISARPVSPQVSGTQVTFTGVASGCPNPRYEFWMRPAASGTWQMVQAYSSTGTLSWNSSGSTGTVYFSVWAKDASSPTATFDSNGTIGDVVNPVACSLTTISASPSSPQLAGSTQVTFTAGASGCPSPRYEFWMRPASSSTWTIAQAYSAGNQFHWNSTGASGTTYVSVWAKDASSSTATFDANATIPFDMSHLCTSVTINAAPNTVVRGAGTHSTVTGNASGCTSPQYEFWMRPASSGTWTMVQTYSASATFDWNSAGATVGIVYISVWAKDASSPTSTFDINATTSITVT